MPAQPAALPAEPAAEPVAEPAAESAAEPAEASAATPQFTAQSQSPDAPLSAADEPRDPFRPSVSALPSRRDQHLTLAVAMVLKTRPAIPSQVGA